MQCKGRDARKPSPFIVDTPESRGIPNAGGRGDIRRGPVGCVAQGGQSDAETDHGAATIATNATTTHVRIDIDITGGKIGELARGHSGRQLLPVRWA